MMRKTIACGIITAMASFNLHADTVLGVYLGAQGWNMETTGSFADNSTQAASAQIADFSFDDQTQGSAYIALEHFVPFVPNVKLIRTQMDTDGITQLSGSFSFGGELYTAQSDVLTQVDLTTTDVILYYEIFDNDLISFDLGINGKVVDGDLLVAEQGSNRQSMESFSGVIPMAYSRVEFGLPFSGLGAYAEGSFLSVGDHTVSDYQVALTYSFIESLALDMTLQVGYRDMSVDLDDLDDLSTDLSFKGAFAGIELDF